MATIKLVTTMRTATPDNDDNNEECDADNNNDNGNSNDNRNSTDNGNGNDNKNDRNGERKQHQHPHPHLERQPPASRRARLSSQARPSSVVPSPTSSANAVNVVSLSAFTASPSPTVILLGRQDGAIGDISETTVLLSSSAAGALAIETPSPVENTVAGALEGDASTTQSDPFAPHRPFQTSALRPQQSQ